MTETPPPPITPPEPQPPATIGTQPKSADEINGLVGTHLKGFLATAGTIHQDQNFFSVTDLKAAPYYFSGSQEALLKSCLHDLDAALSAIDRTFINQIVGMF